MTVANRDIVWADDAVRAARSATGRDHAGEADLARLVELAKPGEKERALDVVTGLGYVALALAPQVAKVDAVDPDEELLAEARRIAESEGVTNVDFLVGDPSALPCESKRYDIVTARMALRHTSEADACLGEIRRVVKPSGRVLLIDSLAPQQPELAGFLEDLMAQHDRSHVRSYTLAEWETLLDQEDFNIDQIEIYPKEHDYEVWAKRLGADSDSVRMLSLMLHRASPRAKRHFRLVERGARPVSFVTWMVLLLAFPRRASET